MEFLITSYIYPLAEPISLSSHLGFSLDNPRSPLEIEVVKDYLVRAYQSGVDFEMPISSDQSNFSVVGILEEFRKALSSQDSFVAETFTRFHEDHIFDFLASIWVVARFEDEGLGEALRQDHRSMWERGDVVVTMLDDDHPLVQRPTVLANYCSLLSLLSHTEGESYFGRTFLFDPEPVGLGRPTGSFGLALVLFGIESSHYPDSGGELRWTFLPSGRGELCGTATRLDVAFGFGLTEKLLHVGGMLKIVQHDTRDEKTQLMLLTSIIELLITHNPDSSRFNVEDSISKQFQLKASMLVYLNDKSRDINAVRTRLRTIYRQRSNIAHGNFQAVDKYVAGLSKKEDKQEYFSDLIVDLYTYIRAILEESLKDHVFVDFIKDN